MAAHYRCRRCRTRHVFEFAPDTYKRPKKCRHCNGESFTVDKWMMNRNTSMSGMGCMCAGYPVMSSKSAPHRKGSLFCWYRKDGTQRMPGDPDFRDHEHEHEAKKQQQGLLDHKEPLQNWG